MKKMPIAICGIGCRFPGNVSSPEEFWTLLENKKDGIGRIPKERWDADSLYDPDYKTQGKIHIKEGGFIDKIDEFDATFFGIAPVEAHSMDPIQRLLLEHTFEAFEDAGEDINKLEGSRTGVFVGTSSSEYAGIMQNYSQRGYINAHTNTGSSPAINANRISYVFDLRGPSFGVDTACSSSLLAAHLACKSIWSNECDKAIVAGANLMLKPELHIGFSTAGFLSPDARSKSFDAAANGYVRSEGIGVLYLKPLPDAIAQGNKIYATIIGSATNEDGRTNGIALPNPKAQVAVMKEAYKDAGISPSKVTVVEAHGTGTAAGDPLECSSIGEVIGKNRDDICLISSVKSNIGHTELASGSAGLIKLALSLYHMKAPGTVHYKTPNPQIDFETLRLKVTTELTPIPAKNGVAYAGINSFGFGGANVHLVLCSAKKPQEILEDSSKDVQTFPYPLVFSARSEAALLQLAKEYSVFLKNSKASLSQVSKKVAQLRSHMEIRGAVVASCKEEAIARLNDFAKGSSNPFAISGRKLQRQQAKTAFVFSGQGPQWFAMGRQLLKENATFKKTIEEVNQHLHSLGWLKEEKSSLLEELLKSEADSRINLTHIVQPALFALQVGLARIWMELGILPDMVVGHSIGEVAASYISGALLMEQAVKVVYHRSRSQSKASGRGKMMAVGLSVDDVNSILPRFEGKIDLAAINGPSMLTLAGDAHALETLEEMLKEDQVFCRFLVVDVPFHSYLLEDVTADFIDKAPDFCGKKTDIPMYSTVTGSQVEGKKITRAYWAQNIRQSVLFYPTIEKMVEDGANTFIEISPHPILAHGVKAAMEAVKVAGSIVPSLRRGEQEAQTLSLSLSQLHINGFEVDWKKVFSKIKDLDDNLPRYPWQRDRFWLESKEAKSLRRAEKVHQHLRKSHEAADNPNDIIWDIELDARTDPYILDHRVQGPLVYPGAGHVDLVVAAGLASFGSKFCFIEQMEFMTPLFLKDSGTPYAVSIHIDTDEGNFTIASKDKDAHDAVWTIHSKGKINHLGDKFYSQEQNLETLKNTITEPVELEPLFEVLKKGGLDLGETFRGIEVLKRNEKEALGKIAIHPKILPTLSFFNLHPALLDASFQSAFGIIEDCSNMGVYIPRKIQRVKFYKKPTGNYIYSYALARRNEPSTILVDIWIFDEDGTLVAEVIGFLGQYLKGSRGEIEGQLDSLFHIYEQQKSLRKSQLQNRKPSEYLQDFKEVKDRLTAFRNELQKEDKFIPFLEVLSPAMDELALAYIYEAFDKLGTPLLSGTAFEVQTINIDLGISDKHSELFTRIISELLLKGILCKSQEKYIVVPQKQKPSVKAVFTRLNSDLKDFRAEVNFFAEAGAALADVLTEKEDAAQVLFAQNRWNDIVDYYTNAYSMEKYNRALAVAFGSLVEKSDNRPLRILEIGAGTGGVTQALLPLLTGKDVNYVFSDISPMFLERAKERFSQYTFVEYALFNVEKEKEVLELLPYSFDVIIASNVLHATLNIEETLKNVRSLLAQNGALCLLEVTGVPLYIDLSFGMTKGWWRFKDGIRQNHCTLKGAEWIKTLDACGFKNSFEFKDVEDGNWPVQSIILASAAGEDKIAAKPENSSATWLMLCSVDDILAQKVVSRLKENKEKCIELRWCEDDCKGTKDNMHICSEDMTALTSLLEEHRQLPLKIVMTYNETEKQFNEDPQKASENILNNLHKNVLLSAQLLQSDMENTTVFNITVGVHRNSPNIVQSPLWGMGRVMFNELSNIKIRLIDVDETTDANVAYLLDELLDADNGDEEVILKNSVRHCSRMKKITRDERQLRASQSRNSKGEMAHLVPSDEGILSRCSFLPKEDEVLQSDEVQIDISFAGLNFRDVMIAGGTLPQDAVEGGLFGYGLGLECCGTVSAVGNDVSHVKKGDMVIAIAQGTIAGATIAKAAFVLPLPAGISGQSGAALPMAALTAYTALFYLGKIEKGDRVLIHSAAGGVGLLGVHYALAQGAIVYATASSPKRKLLEKMGVKNIYNSRDTSYYSSIMEDTKGLGVDIVLNSLAGDHVTQSLKLLAPMGRFIEIGKADLYKDKKIGIKLLANNISYFALDIDRLLLASTSKMSLLFKQALALLEKQGWPSLPVLTYSFADAPKALAHMASGKHMGKIVLEAGPIKVLPPEKLVLKKNAAYLVAGGTRGFGLAVAEFLASKGASYIVLVSRTGLTGEEEKDKVAQLEKKKVKIVIKTLDITVLEDVKKIVNEIHSENRPLAGVFQSTLVLHDELLRKMNRDQLEKPLSPKIAGTWNLHCATLHLDLDYFIMFSSVSSLFGLPGQANYAAANRFLDDFSRYRQALGKKATTVNWGPLADTGFVARENKVHDYLELSGWQPLFSSEALQTLEKAMLEGHSQVGVFDLDWSRLEKAFPNLVSSGRFVEIKKNSSQENADNESGDIRERLLSATGAARKEIIFQLLGQVLAKILEMDQSKVDFETPINRMGLDSLMSNQLRSVLTSQSGVEFSLMQIMQGPTLSQLAAEIEQKIEVIVDSKEKPKSDKSAVLYWAKPLKKIKQPKIRLFTLPYLGAGASVFSNWDMGNEIEICPIQLPGREDRRAEEPITVGKELIEATADGIAALLDVPFALYGHSFGGNLAMSLASFLQFKRNKLARHVFIGAAVPPGVENPLESEFKIIDSQDALSISEEKMTALLARIGTPSSLLQNKKTIKSMMPALRADLAITRQRLFPLDHKLNSPITAIAAENDHIYSSKLLEKWQVHTSIFNLKIIKGNHLFIHEKASLLELLDFISGVLKK